LFLIISAPICDIGYSASLYDSENTFRTENAKISYIEKYFPIPESEKDYPKLGGASVFLYCF